MALNEDSFQPEWEGETNTQSAQLECRSLSKDVRYNLARAAEA